MKILRLVLLLSAVLTLSCQQREDRLRTDRTGGLVKELLTKLDSVDVYEARKEARIDDLKSRLKDASTYNEEFDLLYEIANQYAHYSLDSSLYYIEKAAYLARNAGDEGFRIYAEIRRSTMLTTGGFYMEAAEILSSLPRNILDGVQVILYYNAWMTLYRDAYASSYEPDNF